MLTATRKTETTKPVSGPGQQEREVRVTGRPPETPCLGDAGHAGHRLAAESGVGVGGRNAEHWGRAVSPTLWGPEATRDEEPRPRPLTAPDTARSPRCPATGEGGHRMAKRVPCWLVPLSAHSLLQPEHGRAPVTPQTGAHGQPQALRRNRPAGASVPSHGPGAEAKRSLLSLPPEPPSRDAEPGGLWHSCGTQASLFRAGLASLGTALHPRLLLAPGPLEHQPTGARRCVCRTLRSVPAPASASRKVSRAAFLILKLS